ncbi:barnase inhibitor [Brevibacillus dissolubilis]|uniref:barnase inhibitor n=1 Tax=Brevibacillus dissolubilis TaxID=1844116 RepID=UPI001117495C|nr:barnase inhibitor [Brevibacillus dissolubilis]
MSRFSLIDDDSRIIIGSCKNIVGLSGDCITEFNHESYHKITLINFVINDAFNEHCMKSKVCITNIDLSITNQKGEQIGAYYFSLKDPVCFQKDGDRDGWIHSELIGTLLSVASKETLEIWDIWREAPPTTKNVWAQLSEEQRKGWLEVIRLKSQPVLAPQEQQNDEYFLDATYVTDSTSFFYALGEAINGPGGYYGFDLNSLQNCFCGGFGAVPPFDLHIKKNNIDCSDESNFVLGADESFYQQLRDIFIANRITIIYS